MAFRSFVRALAVAACAAFSGCVPIRILTRNVAALASTPRAPVRDGKLALASDERLAVRWIGHATMLLQLGDRVVLTDPVLTQTVGAGFSKRLVAPALTASELPPIDVALISHLHFDHLSLGTLDLLENKLAALLAPPGALAYMPEYRFPIDEVSSFRTVERRDMQLTAVAVRHPGFRYGADEAWKSKGATAWVIQYHGLTVYFGGDSAYDRNAFVATRKRFPHIDLALLPIGPVEPPTFARPTHMDGREALSAFIDLGADHMVPMHFDTFAHGIDEAGYAVGILREAMKKAGIGEDRVHILPIGGRFALPVTATGR